MNRTRAALLSVATLGIIFTGAPVSGAQPGVPGHGQKPTVAATDATSHRARLAAPDGRVWVFEHENWTGRGCGYLYNFRDYRSSGDCGDMDNITTAMRNSGWTGDFDDVRFHRDYTYSGPNMCLGVGDAWGNLDLGWEVFNTGEHANDKISSHIWANSCP